MRIQGDTVSLVLIIPCYNEVEIIRDTYKQLSDLLHVLSDDGTISKSSVIVFIDDGSTDGTWSILDQLTQLSNNVKAIKLSKNYGHQFAILAGLMTFKDFADCCITIDADLQDDISVIKSMVEKYKQGNEIVYGVRSSRESDTFFKKQSAQFYYKLLRGLGVNIVYNHADFRLAGKNAIAELSKFHEVNLFLRGIFPLLGFKTTIVFYSRLARKAGVTKFSLLKMIQFSLDGITSFSVSPLRLITLIGFFVFVLSMIMSVYAVYSYFAYDTVKGWMSTTLPMYFLGGIQLLSIGVIGEYLGKLYTEVKQRPRYIIEKIIDNNEQ